MSSVVAPSPANVLRSNVSMSAIEPSSNSAPPPLVSTPPTKKEGMSFQSFITGILFLVLGAVAIWYGWVLGQYYGRPFLLYFQAWGAWIRGWFV